MPKVAVEQKEDVLGDDLPGNEVLNDSETREVESEDDETAVEIDKEEKIIGETGGDIKKGSDQDGVKSEVEEEEEKSISEPSPEIAALKQQLADLTEKFGKREEFAAPAPRELSDDEKEKVAQRFGVSSYEAVEELGSYVGRILASAMKPLQDRLSRFEKDAAITEMSQDPKFNDIRKHSAGIDEFLKDYNATLHSNKNFLEKAYFYAKGKGAGAQAKKIVNNKQINLKVLKKGLSSTVNKGGGGSKSAVRLTANQLRLAEENDMTPEEYAKFMTHSVSELSA